ncbi:MAG TPA: ABC transporter ATP-binding protein [Steroidobacteraceae bacterium]|nr:ABC transporter ATP-binding protein [Steroidobacteraceae bacterium]
MLKPTEARVPKPGAVLHLYRDLWRLLRGERHVFVSAVVLLVAAQTVLLAVPVISGRALNALQLHGRDGLREAGFWLSTVLLVALSSWALHGPARILERRAALTVRRRMSATLIERLFSLPLSWHSQNHSGATAHRIQQSTLALSGFAQSQFIYLNSAVRLIGPLIALWWLQPTIGYAALGGFAVITVSVVGFDRAMLRLAHQENQAERRYTATLVDTLGNANTVYALRQARAVAARLERRLLAVFEPLRRSIVLNEAKWFTVDISSRVLSCLLVGLFAWLATRPSADGQATATLLLGSVYMVWEYAQQSSNVICSIASHFQTFARQNADYASAAAIPHSSPAEAVNCATAQHSTNWHTLAVRDLTFSHAAHRGDHPALEKVALSLQRGKRYALIGGSGSGKSTLLRVLAGLYSPERIGLTIDGGAICVAPTTAATLLRATATLIPQDAELYEGTLAENLSLCESVNGPPSPAEFAPALEAACATDFIEPTGAGLEAPLAERAANWSGGQRSRVALARGILAATGSGLVLLDEPTASLDPSTEARVYANLFDLLKDACVISSVHRLHLLGNFDEVLVMQAGRLVAQGTPDELALTCREFQRLTFSAPEDPPADRSSAAA